MSEEINITKMYIEEFKALRNDYIELQQENTQLKEELKDENNYHEEASKWYKEAFDTTQENIKLKSVLKEIREFCDYLLNNDKVSINGKVYYKTFDDDIVTKKLLEIIDKGIGEEND